MAGFVFFSRSGSSNVEPILHSASEQLAPRRAGCIEGSLKSPLGALRWMCHPNAPVGMFEDRVGGFAVVWGEPVAYDGNEILRAEDLYQRI